MENTFKKAMSKFATGVCVVTYINKDDNSFHGLTVSSFSSLSLSPPKVLFCIVNDVNSKSYQLFKNADKFAVSILSSKQSKLAFSFAAKDKGFNDILDNDIIFVDNLPVVNNSLANIICEKGSTYKEGDHDIITGNVVSINLDEQDRDPLLYFQSNIIDDLKLS